MIGEDAKQILRRLMTFIMGLPVDERTYPLAFLVELRKMISSRNFNLGKEIDQNQFINTYGKINAPMGDANVFFNFLQEVAQEFNLPLGCVNHVFLIVMYKTILKLSRNPIWFIPFKNQEVREVVSNRKTILDNSLRVLQIALGAEDCETMRLMVPIEA